MRFSLVCSFITVLFALQPEDDGELVQFQLHRFVSHGELEFYFSGEHYKLQLVANHDLINDESTQTCHYLGYVLEPSQYTNSSNLALSLCPNRGIRGSIITHDKTLSIIPSSSSDTHKLTEDHLVSQQSIKRTPSEHVSRHLLGSYDRNKVELYVLIDPPFTKVFKDNYGSNWKSGLISQIKDEINDVSAEYEWWNWGNAGKIQISIITLEIVEDFTDIYSSLRPPYQYSKFSKTQCPSSDHWSKSSCVVDGYNYLSKFSTFVKENNRYGDNHILYSWFNGGNPNTKGVFAGLGQLGVVCRSGAASIITNRVYGYRIKTIAHEIGHNFGINHDSSGIKGVMGIYDRQELLKTKPKVCDPVTGGDCVADTRKLGWSTQSKNELNDYFEKKNGLSCLKDGVRSFTTIHNPTSGSYGGSSGGSSGSCVEIRSFSSYYNGEWKADGTKNGKRKYRNPNRRGIQWLYWTGKYWTMNNDYNDGVNADNYCLESDVTDCDSKWVSYGQTRSARFADCGSFTTNEEGLECLSGNEYRDNVCVHDKEFTIADVCYNDKPVYNHIFGNISYHLYSDVYYEYLGNDSKESISEWLISLYDVASLDIVAKCDESDLLECSHGKWQVVYKGNDTVTMIIDEQMYVTNGKCGAEALTSSSPSIIVIVWICIGFAFVLLLSIFGFFICRRRANSKQLKQIMSNIGDESEEEEVEVEVELVDTKLTQTMV